MAEKFEEIDIISKNNIKIVPSAIIAGAIYYMIIMLSVVAITDMLHLTTISNYLTGLITYLPKVFTAFAFLIVGFLFSEFIRKVFIQPESQWVFHLLRSLALLFFTSL
jgi:ABC-type multidrug transport system permease subunit